MAEDNQRPGPKSAAQSLYQLIGAPLYALIQAETHAANATADFIDRMGFEAKGESQSAGDLGTLRTISFTQSRRTADGQPATYKVEVPLLSILPIPALQVKEAELEFSVKIVDMVTLRPKKEGDKPEKKADAEPEKKEGMRLEPPGPKLEMKGLLGRGRPNAPHAQNSAFDMQVHIKIKVAQADPPAGLSRLFNLMEESISSTRLEEPRKIEPENGAADEG